MAATAQGPIQHTAGATQVLGDAFREDWNMVRASPLAGGRILAADGPDIQVPMRLRASRGRRARGGGSDYAATCKTV